MRRLRELLLALRSSLWIIPGGALVLAVMLGILLVGVDARLESDLAERWPRLFGAGPEGARGTLEAIAGSMITVAGVVFSVTIVALSLAASTYSPRILRTFMHDRGTQSAFGVFVGAFAYCLVVLRTVRVADDSGSAFVPSVAVLGALVLAIAAVCVLVYFIHHVVVAIQVSTILSRVADETSRAIDTLFPEPLGEGEDDSPQQPPAGLAWQALPARRSGYIVSIDTDRLLAWAAERDFVVRMELGVGEFAIESLPLASIAGPAPDEEKDGAALDASYSLADERTIEQDPEFGVQQLVDVAVRALSPGVNDPTTARMCIHHLAGLLVRLARRREPSRLRTKDGKLRVVTKAPDFASLCALAFDTLARYAEGKAEVLATLRGAAERVASAAPRSRRARLAVYLPQERGYRVGVG
ncbi:MAG TPA: DUF2254 domain-containing protein [Burkholderiales bacterium]|nr:DUF2254 domain-containing protein [Burkholderiales bacterium]